MKRWFREGAQRVELVRCGCGLELPASLLLQHLLGEGRWMDFREHVEFARGDVIASNVSAGGVVI